MGARGDELCEPGRDRFGPAGSRDDIEKGSAMNDGKNATPVFGALDPRRDRAIGAFIGLAVGDALGTTIEFKARDTYTRSPG